MKIAIIRDNYTHIADLTDQEDPELMPSVEDVVDACLYLLSFYYKEADVQKAAKEWEP